LISCNLLAEWDYEGESQCDIILNFLNLTLPFYAFRCSLHSNKSIHTYNSESELSGRKLQQQKTLLSPIYVFSPFFCNFEALFKNKFNILTEKELV
jgi:hypothetical protein